VCERHLVRDQCVE